MQYIRIDEFSDEEAERMKSFIADFVVFQAIEAFRGFALDVDDSVCLSFDDFRININGGAIYSAVLKKIGEKKWVNKLMRRSLGWGGKHVALD